MKRFYSDEKNIQILIALLKAHNIRYVVASPGNTNLTLVASLQQDPYFIIYSCVDERSAAYIACGIAAAINEPVVISCTGATASRNYMSALTEAYYRKLPIITVTSSRQSMEIGHLVAQVTDRTQLPNDIAKKSVQLPVVKDSDTKWECEVKINDALLESRRHGGGPVHINIPTIYCPTYKTEKLPEVKVINRFQLSDHFPDMSGKIAIWCGSHKYWTEKDISIVDTFCSLYNAIVLCDHTSNYKGKYGVFFSLIGGQEQYVMSLSLDILIHIGEISGDYFTCLGKILPKEVWRVNEDGEVRDFFKRLTKVFEINEIDFFKKYNELSRNKTIISDFYDSISTLYNSIYKELEINENQLPFSNIWTAFKLAPKIPKNSDIHFGILSSLRSWNFFKIDNTITANSNVGGFGIDGCVSTLIGASLTDPQKIHFGIFGDLAFFYDLNSIGNHHITNNLRILVINNGIGAEFKLYCYPGSKLGDDVNDYIAAKGHFGKQSMRLLKHYSEDLGFKYLSASTKDEFSNAMEIFINPKITDKPILFEVFTTSENDNTALRLIRNLVKNNKGVFRNFIKQHVSDDFKNVILKITK